MIGEHCIVFHTGIVVNEDKVWPNLEAKKSLEIDTEVIAAIADQIVSRNDNLTTITTELTQRCEGVISCAIAIPKLGKLILYSNNGSLYSGKIDETIIFSSERFVLDKLKYKYIEQINQKSVEIEIRKITKEFIVNDIKSRTENLIPNLNFNQINASLLENQKPTLLRCKKCVLPETMPFIKFDSDGICNYCRNYKIINKRKSKDDLYKLLEGYKRVASKSDCIVPFSGGRDSCYGLHLIVNELEMKPITYTYDWGMVTDLGRRNISRCAVNLG